MANSVVDERRTTYDIACQWSRNRRPRSLGFPQEFASRLVCLGLRLHFGIPKFHSPAHGDKCQSSFFLNLVDGWARVDGEAIERVWVAMNPFAPSAKEMAGGKYHNFLEGQFGYMNWRKVVNMGVLHR
jgi:hypothetical protein